LVVELKRENKNGINLKTITLAVLGENKKGNVGKNVTLRRVRATLFAVEKR
jgi:hypothetical protein